MFCLLHTFQGKAGRPELPVPGVAVILGNGLEGVHGQANAPSSAGPVAMPPIRIEPGQNESIYPLYPFYRPIERPVGEAFSLVRESSNFPLLFVFSQGTSEQRADSSVADWYDRFYL